MNNRQVYCFKLFLLIYKFCILQCFPMYSEVRFVCVFMALLGILFMKIATKEQLNIDILISNIIKTSALFNNCTTMNGDMILKNNRFFSSANKGKSRGMLEFAIDVDVYYLFIKYYRSHIWRLRTLIPMHLLLS